MQVTFSRLPPDQVVTSFDPTVDLTSVAALLAQAGEPSTVTPARTDEVAVSVEAGTEVSLWERGGSGTIVRLELLGTPAADLPKIWKLSPPLKFTAMALGAAGLALLGWYVFRNWNTTIWAPSFTAGGVVLLLLLTLGGIMVPLLKWLNPQRAMQGYAWKAMVAVAGWVFTNLHLWIFDPLFLRRGRLKRLLRLPGN